MPPKKIISPAFPPSQSQATNIQSAPVVIDELSLDYDVSLEKLQELQEMLYKLRSDLPSLLRSMSQLDERDTTTGVFYKCVNSVSTWNNNVEEFLRKYSESRHLIELGRRERNDLQAGNQSNGLNNDLSSTQSFLQSGLSQDQPIIL